MNKVILMLTLLTFAFPNVYISYDLKTEIKIAGDKESADKGQISIGYEDYYEDDSPIMIGVSLGVIEADFNGVEPSLSSIYGKYVFENSAWAMLGYAFPGGDFDELDAGLQYGFGYTSSDGFGLYIKMTQLSISNSYSYDYYDYETSENIDVTQIGFSYNF